MEIVRNRHIKTTFQTPSRRLSQKPTDPEHRALKASNIYRNDMQFKPDYEEISPILKDSQSYAMENLNSSLPNNQFKNTLERFTSKKISIVRQNPKKELECMLKKIGRKVVVRSFSYRRDEEKILTSHISKTFDASPTVKRQIRMKTIQIEVQSNPKKDKTNQSFNEDEDEEIVPIEQYPVRSNKRKSSAQRVFLDHDSPIKRKTIVMQFLDKDFKKEHANDQNVNQPNEQDNIHEIGRSKLKKTTTTSMFQ